MKIAMFTNTYLPHVGGVANSVKTFEEEYRSLGHQVLVIAPEFPGAEESTEHVKRIPAIQNFNGSDFSVRIPTPNIISNYLEEFAPDLIHSHHPFLLGDSALRAGAERNIPVVFTHHTMYEMYTHYVPMNSDALKRAAIQLAVEYSNLCSAVIAPSESVQTLLKKRGVESPITTIPTGIDLKKFGGGNGGRGRQAAGIPADAKVIGHVGRLAAEKNLRFLAEGIGRCLQNQPGSVALIVGSGDDEDEMFSILGNHAGADRIFKAGKLTGDELCDAYAAMDIFAFSSMSETQGMVLAEAMAAGTPVVALDAPGAREVVVDGKNGRLLESDVSAEDFASALAELIVDEKFRGDCSSGALKTVKKFGRRHCARKALRYYQKIANTYEATDGTEEGGLWDSIQRRIETEWNLLAQKAAAAAAAVIPTEATEVKLA